MKVIIAGGRDYRMDMSGWRWLNRMSMRYGPFSEVVSGGAPGADREGEAWAGRYSIPIKRFPADWRKHGKAAGPIRNRAMAEYVGPDGLCLLFPGGDGTASMREEAARAGVKVIESEDLE